MQKEVQQFVEESGKMSKKFHHLYQKQWTYYSDLAERGKFECVPDRIKRLYYLSTKLELEDILNYKKDVFQEGDDGEFVYVGRKE